MEDGFQEISFTRIFTVEQFQELIEIEKDVIKKWRY